MNRQQEKTGVIFVLIEAVMWGMFPVLVNRGVHDIPPMLFAAITTILASIGAFIYTALNGKISELKNKKSYASLIMVTLCIVIIPYILFFIGTGMTSGINSSMLLLSEIIFTLLFTPFIGEKTTSQKLIGALGVFIGAVIISYNGGSINIGDILIILSTATYPIGNFYAKKALNNVSPSVILFVRFFLGGIFILAVSFLLEPSADIIGIFSKNIYTILFTGLILLGLSKIIFYEGLKRLDISKAISIANTFPVFSLIFLMAFYKEIPTVQQFIGILIMLIGLIFAIKRQSADPTTTKYAVEIDL